jgi:hypothetical protein
MEDLLFRATVVIAVRLATSQLRLYICRLKESEDPSRWAPLIKTEQDLQQDAQRAWILVRERWASFDELGQLLKDEALRQAFKQAVVQTQEHFTRIGVDSQWVMQRLQEFQ